MTVKQLMEKLKEFDPALRVMINEQGYDHEIHDVYFDDENTWSVFIHTDD